MPNGIEAQYVGHDGDDGRRRSPLEETASSIPKRPEQIPGDVVVDENERMEVAASKHVVESPPDLPSVRPLPLC